MEFLDELFPVGVLILLLLKLLKIRVNRTRLRIKHHTDKQELANNRSVIPNHADVILNHKRHYELVAG